MPRASPNTARGPLVKLSSRVPPDTGAPVIARPSRRAILACLSLTGLLASAPRLVHAQDNYEIQVYSAPTMDKGHTIFELHSNYTFDGRRTVANGVQPTHHAAHYTLEITHGFTDWFEVGAYAFITQQPAGGFNYVGSHIRPRIAAPESWHLPVGLSLSAEVGFQRRDFAEDTWNAEIRPIIDKQVGRAYFAFNPVLGKSFRGATSADGFAFEPSGAATFDVTKQVNVGAEYYGGLGTLRRLAPPNERDHLLFGVLNLNLSPAYEFNFGIGRGLGSTAEKSIVKLILGRRI